MTSHLTAWVWPAPGQWDTRFAANSLATVIVVVGITLIAVVGRARPDLPCGVEPAQ